MQTRSPVARFPIGLTFSRKRFPKATELTEYTIVDILTTYNNAGECVKLEYMIAHSFMGSKLMEMVVDPTIARSLSPEQMKQFIK